jgi:hypothetical protein
VAGLYAQNVADKPAAQPLLLVLSPKGLCALSVLLCGLCVELFPPRALPRTPLKTRTAIPLTLKLRHYATPPHVDLDVIMFGRLERRPRRGALRADHASPKQSLAES